MSVRRTILGWLARLRPMQGKVTTPVQAPAAQGTREVAFAFDSDLRYEQVFERLNAAGPWSWRDRDSAWYGNYASAWTPTPGGGSLKVKLIESGANGIGGTVIAGSGRRYAISATFESTAESAAPEWEAIRRTITDRVLPSLEASSVCPTEPID
jgi:hypothetical protein